LVKAIERGVLVIAFPFFVAGAFFTPQLVTRSATLESSPGVASPAAAASPDVLDARDEAPTRDELDDPADGGEGFTDLYGNEVTDASATYTFDRSGSLYELHSPQTELPRLGIPKS
jgi:hypothetical protein